MDRYKQNLCLEYSEDCKDEEDLFRYIVENEHEYGYEYKLNVDGKLHSRYLEEFGCYEPAIIHKEQNRIWLFWLFDGEIKDCRHPFVIIINRKNNYVRTIRYYSLERIRQQQPICLNYFSDGRSSGISYNEFVCDDDVTAIIDDPNIPSNFTTEVPHPYNTLDMSQFVTIAPGVICPLWSDEFAGNNGLFKFKFED